MFEEIRVCRVIGSDGDIRAWAKKDCRRDRGRGAKSRAVLLISLYTYSSPTLDLQVDETSLWEQPMNRCLTTFESRCRFPISTARSLTFVTSSRSTTSSRSYTTSITSVLPVSSSPVPVRGNS